MLSFRGKFDQLAVLRVIEENSRIKQLEIPSYWFTENKLLKDGLLRIAKKRDSITLLADFKKMFEGSFLYTQIFKISPTTYD